VQVEAKSEPILIVGYHKPSARSKDDQTYDAMANIIGQGRSSRIFTSLVKEKKIAVQAGALNGWPGSKYPNLCAFYAVPAKGQTSEECLKAIDAEIEKIKNEPVSDDELTKYKRSTVKSFIDQMKGNSSMAGLLTNYDVIQGDWRDLFEQTRKIQAITAADVQRVARATLVKKNRTIGEIVPEPAEPAKAQ
jgi:predicted Zn-dependent peptidase